MSWQDERAKKSRIVRMKGWKEERFASKEIYRKVYDLMITIPHLE